MLSHSWPGNIRELRNVIERIVVLSPIYKIDKNTVAEAIQLGKSPSKAQISKIEVIKSNTRRDELVKALTEYNGNKTKTALNLGVSEATIHRWLKEFDLNKVFSAQAFKKKGMELIRD